MTTATSNARYMQPFALHTQKFMLGIALYTRPDSAARLDERAAEEDIKRMLKM